MKHSQKENIYFIVKLYFIAFLFFFFFLINMGTKNQGVGLPNNILKQKKQC